MKLGRTSLGFAVRSARTAAEMTASDLGVLAGITASAISRTEAGLRDLSFAEAHAISRVLGISVSTLQDLAETFEREGHELTGLKVSEIQRDLSDLQRQAIEAVVALAADRR